MNKMLLSIAVALIFLPSACASPARQPGTSAPVQQSGPDTITYPSEHGPIQVPAHPKRVVALSFAGNLMALGINLVGVDTWSKMNPRFEKTLSSVQEVSDESLEKIAALEPDLIIGMSTIKNADKLNLIAPTVTYTYGSVDYLTQQLEIGKLVNKEKEAQAWIDDFKKRAQQAGKDIKAKIGENATVSVFESSDKQIYVFGDNWGRGTEILYREMKLSMPDKVKETALKPGYYALSLEVLPAFAGDYVIFSKNKDADNAFQQTELYKGIPAVKNNRVFEVNAKEFYFNDPLTLDYQLDFFIKSFLGR
ncbi:iron-hydroxamate ABC transporter substrate-binding protein [Paenibacillus allorhizosphaerae]|uniref:Iron(3+)-hydroxamate-binding protein FhuD n=1 Tax=Paenibacillus allorhizosphaerae TaxID=2849866 RepID=A0ABM8VGI3_9BACL|nr:iron-hydroxamate ABC transporter substrate-binding protein [Paenibacillus allorhizosphaerae]CAG7638618.1 Iron(3+)-hydroxamate-binding protein FhuD [Paenibacillus allorhizosphaerae]